MTNPSEPAPDPAVNHDSDPGRERSEVAGPASLAQLLATYTAWNGRNVLAHAARRAAAGGDTERAATLRALFNADSAAPTAMEALRAQYELASLLEGWRWQTVAAAREVGATWDQIAQATATDPAQARRDYLERIEDQARYGLTVHHELARYRAAAGDLEHTDNDSPEDTMTSDPVGHEPSDTRCPECDEPAVPRPPATWTPAWGERPGWSHTDGEPLCPVVNDDGYRPATPIDATSSNAWERGEDAATWSATDVSSNTDSDTGSDTGAVPGSPADTEGGRRASFDPVGVLVEQSSGDADGLRAPAVSATTSVMMLPWEALSERGLVAHAADREAAARSGSAQEAAAARVELGMIRAEAERRAVDQPTDSIPAQVAGYVSLLVEDEHQALRSEAHQWRAELDQHLTDTPHAVSAVAEQRPPAQLACDVDARMSAEPSGEGFDLDRLDEVTERWGYAVVDPAVPGGVRAPSPTEYAELLGQLAPPTRGAERAEAPAQEQPPRGYEVDDLTVRQGEAEPYGREWPSAPAEQVAEVERRTADPAFAYNPRADWGDGTYREPRSDAEAAARTAHLDAQRASDPSGPPPGSRALTEVEDAIDDALERATLADRAHDPDPQAWAEYHRLLALHDLAPVPDEDTDAAGAGDVRKGGDGREQAAIDVFDRGPWTDERGRQWSSRGEWATTTARENAAVDRPSVPDDPAQLQRRVDEARARLAARDSAAGADSTGEDGARREQLTRWHDDDSGRHHAIDDNDGLGRDVDIEPSSDGGGGER